MTLEIGLAWALGIPPGLALAYVLVRTVSWCRKNVTLYWGRDMPRMLDRHFWIGICPGPKPARQGMIQPYKLTLWASWDWFPKVHKVYLSYLWIDEVLPGATIEYPRRWGDGSYIAASWTGREWETYGWSWPFCWGGNLGYE